MKILEKYVEICGKMSDMASLLLALSRSAKSAQITADFEVFCKEIEEALELAGKMQYELAEEAWDLVEILEATLQQDDETN